MHDVLLVKGMYVILFCSVADSKLYLHGGVESEAANTCADGLFVFIPGNAWVCGSQPKRFVSAMSLCL